MFEIKFKDGTIFNATSVEESYRTEANGKSYIALTIQNDNAVTCESIDVYKEKFTSDNLSVISVYDNTGAKLLVNYKGYAYIRYLTSRVQANGNILYDFNFMKVDPLNL